MIRVRPGSLSTSRTCAGAPWRQQGAALLLHGLPTQTRLTPPRDGRLPGRDMEVSKESGATSGSRRAANAVRRDRYGRKRTIANHEPGAVPTTPLTYGFCTVPHYA